MHQLLATDRGAEPRHSASAPVLSLRGGLRLAVCGGALLFAGLETACANAISVTNVMLTNVGGGTADVQFDLSWSNSWRSAWSVNGGDTLENWDAAWVFIKYRVAGGAWKSARLSADGHAAPTGVTITPSDDSGVRLGAFIYRSEAGAGTLDCAATRLRWDLLASGLAGTNQVDVAVFAAEMVYIPEGPFYLGSGSETENGAFQSYPSKSSPFRITNESALVVAAVTNSFYYPAYYNSPMGYYAGDQGSPVSNAFPKGFAAFYCMKHEISQGQYADFLNVAQPGVAAARFANTTARRHTITATNGIYYCTAPDRACNYLGVADLLAFLDWAGLRPLSELEFEKVCRGPLAPVAKEYAWGDTLATAQTGHSGVDGSGSETAVPASANSHCSTTFDGPVRCGIFATPSSDRHASGAGYYGVMELSGNLMEGCVTIGTALGRTFTGQHGDGDENVQPPSWSGLGRRGGSYAAPNSVSERYLAATGVTRDQYNGGRGCRTAP